MRKTKKTKTPEFPVLAPGQRSQQEVDFATTEPDSLRDSVREAMSGLSEEDRRAANDKLLTALKRGGVNIGQHLLLLGIPARTAQELTAPDVATLIRYVRISEPRAMTALAGVLTELLTKRSRPPQRAKASRRAA